MVLKYYLDGFQVIWRRNQKNYPGYRLEVCSTLEVLRNHHRDAPFDNRTSNNYHEIN
ncbi:hypothetical protein FDUTEX481_01720 [Tolypothrix sp. PCC 7601]|nr:hypothetical protein FDUTEX481_01720 [Tolypothrix sp. PCC 7601]